jgi:hypothetical protein
MLADCTAPVASFAEVTAPLAKAVDEMPSGT